MGISYTNILYIIIGVVIFVLLTVLITICACIRCSGRKKLQERKQSSSPSHLVHDPELVYHDRLSKAPMLPNSLSTNSSFNPYDPNSLGPLYDPQPQVNMYEPMPYEHHSTMSSKNSYNTVSNRPDSKFLHRQAPYDMDSCLTSL